MAEELKIVITVVENASKAVRGIKDEFNRLSEQVERTGNDIKAFQDKVNSIANKLILFGTAVTAGVGALIYSSTRLSSEIERLSKTSGVAEDQVWALRGALGDLEVNFDAIAHAIPRMSLGLMQIRRWMDVEYLSKTFNLTYIQAYRTANTIHQLVKRVESLQKTGKSSGEILLAVVSGLKQISDESVRAAVAQMLFRGAAEDVLILTRYSNEEISRLIKIYQQTSPSPESIRAMDELGDSISTLKTAFQGLVTEVLAAVAPQLTKLVNALTDFVVKLKEIVSHHPTIARLALGFVMLGGVVAQIVGWLVKLALVLNLIGGGGGLATLVAGISSVFGAIGGVIGGIVSVISGAVSAIGAAIGGLAATIGLPVLIIVAILSVLIAIGIAIWRNWDTVKGFLVKVWDFIKEAWTKAVNAIVKVLSTVIEKGRQIWMFFKSLPSRMFEAGRELILSLWRGIMSLINKPIEAVKSLAQRIRNYLPFSPAKEGALKDLPQAGFGFVETFASSILAAQPILTNAMNRLTSGIALPTISVGMPAMRYAIAYNRYAYDIRIVASSEKYVHEEVDRYLREKLPDIIRRIVKGR